MRLSGLAILGILGVVSISVIAQAPIPAALKVAKSVYLLSESAEPKALDELAKPLIDWKRLQLVDAKEKADVTASLDISETSRGAYVIGLMISRRSESSWVLTVRDANTATVLYSDSETIGGFSRCGGLKKLVERWRKRVESAKE